MIDGLIPTYSFYFDNPLRTGGSVERVLIINGVETSRDRIVYSLDSVELSLLNQETLPSRVGDFLDFACAASLADRFSPREVKADQRETSDRLRRRINVSLQMRESQLWSDDDTCHLLENLLDWITDDKWTFSFSRRVVARISEIQLPLGWQRAEAGSSAVCLFSGGLDSLAGVMKLTSEYDFESIYPVSVITQPRRRSDIRELFDYAYEMEAIFRKSVMPLSIRTRWLGATLKKRGKESTHRARCILFLAAGAVAAYQLHQTTLYLYENGIGALALPMAAEHIGARSSKATHPKTLTFPCTRNLETWPLQFWAHR